VSARESIPEEVISIIEKEARKRGLSVAEFLVNSLARELDPRARLEVYVKLHEKYLREAEELSERGTSCRQARSTGVPSRHCSTP
jgi:hypothetical protein